MGGDERRDRVLERRRGPPEPVSPPGVIALRARTYTGRLSNYEFAPLIGVHHNDLIGALDPNRNSIATLIAMSGHTDLHPADLIAGLDPLMRLRRLEPEPDHADPDELDELERDAATALSALTLARGPLSPGALATVFGWSAEHTADVLDFITDNPESARVARRSAGQPASGGTRHASGPDTVPQRGHAAVGSAETTVKTTPPCSTCTDFTRADARCGRSNSNP